MNLIDLLPREILFELLVKLDFDDMVSLLKVYEKARNLPGIVDFLYRELFTEILMEYVTRYNGFLRTNKNWIKYRDSFIQQSKQIKSLAYAKLSDEQVENNFDLLIKNFKGFSIGAPKETVGDRRKTIRDKRNYLSRISTRFRDLPMGEVSRKIRNERRLLFRSCVKDYIKDFDKNRIISALHALQTDKSKNFVKDSELRLKFIGGLHRIILLLDK